jgi:hypothetical protein
LLMCMMTKTADLAACFFDTHCLFAHDESSQLNGEVFETEKYLLGKVKYRKRR